MSNLKVRISDGVVDQHVTKYATGLRFRKTAPGGHADASCTLDLSTDTFANLGPADRMWIYSPAGNTVWDGYTNNPGTKTGRDGQGFEVSALGAAARASDRADRLLYMDRNFTWWQRGGNTAALASAAAEASAAPDTGNPALFMQFQPGLPVNTGDFVQLIYDARPFGGKIGGYNGIFKCGVTDANYQYRFGFEGVATVNWSFTVAGNNSGRLSVTNYTPGPRFAVIRLVRAAGGATTPGVDNVWVALESVVVLGQFQDRNGNDIAAPGSINYVLASHVAEDLLGRILTFCDPITSQIDTTSYQIDQLAYLDAITATGVLDDLLTYEPDMLYEFLEAGATGKHRFNFRAWPTTPRYLIPPSFPVEQPGSDIDLCNRIAVNWTDLKGNPQTTVRGSYVPDLGNQSPVLADGTIDPAFVGRIRDAEPVTIPEGRGSLANAQRLGDQVLAAKSTQPLAATVVVDRPIMDLARGILVQPYELEPGYVARVVSAGDDLRITEMSYDDEPSTATLTLGVPVLTNEQRIARLARVK